MSVWVVLFETGCIDVVYFFSRGTGGAAGGVLLRTFFVLSGGIWRWETPFVFLLG